MSDTLISVQSVSKKFCRRLRRSLWYGVQDIGTELLGRDKNPELRKDEFWAVKDVNFELRRGDCLGLIGHNGAGKSTLLKMLNGLIKPDTGKITMKGRIGALIELGTGFNPILTGRENVYNNGAVLGFTKKEVDNLLEEIVEFSELNDFIDTPVQNYSSGMKVRLGFSVAVHLKPDILLLDEVLAVGDAGFKMKSLNKMYEMISSSAVIFVNHSMATISRVCNKIMYMKGGKLEYFGHNLMEGIEQYLDQYDEGSGFIEYNKEAQITDMTIWSSREVPHDQSGTTIIHYQDDLVIDLKYQLDLSCNEHSIRLMFANKDFLFTSIYVSEVLNNNQDGQNKIRITIPRIELTNGQYSITIHIKADNGYKTNQFYATYRNWKKFKVAGLQQLENASFMLSGQVTFL